MRNSQKLRRAKGVTNGRPRDYKSGTVARQSSGSDPRGFREGGRGMPAAPGCGMHGDTRCHCCRHIYSTRGLAVAAQVGIARSLHSGGPRGLSDEVLRQLLASAGDGRGPTATILITRHPKTPRPGAQARSLLARRAGEICIGLTRHRSGVRGTCRCPPAAVPCHSVSRKVRRARVDGAVPRGIRHNLAAV